MCVFREYTTCREGLKRVGFDRIVGYLNGLITLTSFRKFEK